MKRGSSELRLERVQLMLAPAESDWLDQLTGAILTKTGRKVSRSEIVRAAVKTLQEFHRVEPLDGCESGNLIAVACVLTLRRLRVEADQCRR